MSFISHLNANNRLIAGALGILILVLGLVAVVSRIDPPMSGQGASGFSRMPNQETQPSFEIVRINTNGSAVFSGAATPGATVNLQLNGDHMASTEADIDGDWLYTSANALETGQHMIQITATLKGFADSQTDEVLLVDLPTIDQGSEEPLPNPQAIVFAASSARGMRVLQRNGAGNIGQLLTPAPEATVIEEPETVAVTDTPKVEQVTQPTQAVAAVDAARIQVKRVLHEPQNVTVTVEGMAEPNMTVRAQIEGNPARDALVGSDGAWRVVVAAAGLEQQDKNLSLIQMHNDAAVNNITIRIATPPKEATAKAATGRTEKVRKGDSLWIIAKRVYGDGTQHEKLFQANKDLIKSHKDLKPGMVLRVPD